MERATLKDAPAFLNINDGAMWVLGFNAALDAALNHAYAEGRKDEADENGAASRLIDAWAAAHGRPVPWAKAVEIVAIANKLPDAERTRLLALEA